MALKSMLKNKAIWTAQRFMTLKRLQDRLPYQAEITGITCISTSNCWASLIPAENFQSLKLKSQTMANRMRHKPPSLKRLGAQQSTQA